VKIWCIFRQDGIQQQVSGPKKESMQVNAPKHRATKLGIDQSSRDLIRLHPDILTAQFVQKFRKQVRQLRRVLITCNGKMCRLHPISTCKNYNQTDTCPRTSNIVFFRWTLLHFASGARLKFRASRRAMVPKSLRSLVSSFPKLLWM